MEMLVGGEWCGAVGGAAEVVRSPFDGHSVGSVPVGGVEDAAAAIDVAEVAARLQRETPAYERFAVLLRAADLADERAEDIAQTLSAESGKPISDGARGPPPARDAALHCFDLAAQRRTEDPTRA